MLNHCSSHILGTILPIRPFNAAPSPQAGNQFSRSIDSNSALAVVIMPSNSRV
ncbi:hypothetical protein H6G96_39835 [Nostoc sp. FACHB-892]|nr:hypothetical protein [Nostoc sp. FACHB-892]